MSNDTERMQWALEDIERYVEQLETAEQTMTSLAQSLLDIPGADDAIRTSEGFAQVYAKIAEDLRRLTNRGLSR